jgi:hypothetical protein
MLNEAKQIGEDLKEFLSKHFDCQFCDNGAYISARTKHEYPDGDIIDIFLPSSGILDPSGYRLTDLGETYGWVKTVFVEDVFSDKFYSYFCDYSSSNKCDNIDVYFSRVYKNIFAVSQNISIKKLPDCINEFASYIQKFSNYINKTETVKETEKNE